MDNLPRLLSPDVRAALPAVRKLESSAWKPIVAAVIGLLAATDDAGTSPARPEGGEGGGDGCEKTTTALAHAARLAPRLLLLSLVPVPSADQLVATMREQCSLDEDGTRVVFAALLHIVREAVRVRATDKQLGDALQELKVPSGLADDIGKAVKAQRAAMEAVAVADAHRFPSIDDLRWRCDVAISTTNVARVLKPSVTMNVRLSNGDVHQFEMSVERVGELRYNLAKMLKEMQQVKRKRVMQTSVAARR